MSKQVPWARIAAEGTAILVSILLAFTIQAWWERRGEDERRHAILQRLSSDLVQSDSTLQRVLRQHRASADAAERLIQLTRAGVASAHLQAPVDSLLSDLTWAPIVDPPGGTLGAILISGELYLVSPSLVDDLSLSVALWENLIDRETRLLRAQQVDLIPYLRTRNISYADLNWTAVETASGAPWEVPWELRHTVAYRLLDDPEFESLIADAWYQSAEAARQTAVLTEALRQIRGRVLAELGHGGFN